MDKQLIVPPRSPGHLTCGELLAKQLSPLIGKRIKLTGKSRTDGSNIRKVVANQLVRNDQLPPPADGGWEIVPPKKKGVPKILREFIDTYIVTSGTTYNLQVWNRNPTQRIPHVILKNGDELRANDVRFVLVRCNTEDHRVRTIIVASPDYIERHFGRFGKPTYKEQLIISDIKRNELLKANPPIIFYPDSDSRSAKFLSSIQQQTAKIHAEPRIDEITSLKAILKITKERLIGMRVDPGATKIRGQNLEIIVAKL